MIPVPTAAIAAAAARKPRVELSLGPLGILGLLSAILFAWIALKPLPRRGDYDFFTGLPELVMLALILVFWLGVGVAKLLAWAGWL